MAAYKRTNAQTHTQVVIERKEDEEGNQWFEITQESCELIGFQVRPSVGPLLACLLACLEWMR